MPVPNDLQALLHPDVELTLDVPAFTAVTRTSDTESRVRVRGDLDCTTAPVLGELLTDLIDSGVTSIVVDLAEVSFLGVAGLNVLLKAQNRACAAGGSLLLANPDRCARRVLALTGLDTALPISEA